MRGFPDQAFRSVRLDDLKSPENVTAERWTRRDLNPSNREGAALRTRDNLRSPETVSKERWTRRDLNPWPSRCKRDDLPLIYEPLLSYLRHTIFPSIPYSCYCWLGEKWGVLKENRFASGKKRLPGFLSLSPVSFLYDLHDMGKYRGTCRDHCGNNSYDGDNNAGIFKRTFDRCGLSRHDRYDDRH